jgi:hypothetical protein
MDDLANNFCSSQAEPKWLEPRFAGAELSQKAQICYCSSRPEPLAQKAEPSQRLKISNNLAESSQSSSGRLA